MKGIRTISTSLKRRIFFGAVGAFLLFGVWAGFAAWFAADDARLQLAAPVESAGR